MQRSEKKATVSFGVFELDRAAGQLYRNSRKVRLQEQPLRMLELLLDRAGNLVTRDEIRATLWPDDTFVEFDAAVGNVLRKIRIALGDDAANPRFIQTVPRQGYRFIAPVRSLPEETTAAPEPAASVTVEIETQAPARPGVGWIPRWAVPGLIVASIVALIVGLLALGYEFRRSRRQPGIGDAATTVILTSYPGNQSYPALSPDGNQVAFTWEGEDSGPRAYHSLYIATTNGGGAHRRITSASANDYVPAWSPDGTHIAFVRDRIGLMLTAPLGGTEREIESTAVANFVSWSPDGKEIGYSARDASGTRFAIFATSPETGARRQITHPPAGITGDTQADFSPNGRSLAFVRCNVGSCDIYVMPSGGGGARRLTNDETSFHGLSWSPDSRTIVFASRRRGLYRVWQVNISGNAPPRAVPSAGEESDYPRFAPGPPGAWRLVYEQHRRNGNIWRLGRTPAEPTSATPPQRFIASTRVDSSPQISPDGRRIVFVSDRSGYGELWTADADGHNQNELTFLRSQGAGSPRWSPDSSRIAFDLRSSAGRAVFVIDSHGGPPTQWTDWADGARPSWSRDGRWIYFAQSDSKATQQLWRTSAVRRGKPLQLTHEGGFVSQESLDGKTIYYSVGLQLRSMPAAGGASTPVTNRPIAAGWWGVASDGIYFADIFAGGDTRHPTSAPKPVYLLDPASAKVRKPGEITGEVDIAMPDFCVSPDGGTILYSILELQTSQIHMIEDPR